MAKKGDSNPVEQCSGSSPSVHIGGATGAHWWCHRGTCGLHKALPTLSVLCDIPLSQQYCILSSPHLLLPGLSFPILLFRFRPSCFPISPGVVLASVVQLVPNAKRFLEFVVHSFVARVPAIAVTSLGWHSYQKVLPTFVSSMMGPATPSTSIHARASVYKGT